MTDSDSTSKFAEINGANIHYEQVGQGQDIVFVHAGIADSSMWDEQVTEFSRTLRVTRYDLRGFGRSSIPPAPFTQSADLAELFRHLGIENAIVVGASFGGNVSADFALEHPDLISGLILVNSLVGSTAVSPELRAGWDRVNAAVAADDIELAIEIEQQMWVDGQHRSPAQVDPVLRERVRTMNAKIFARVAEQELAEELDLDPPANQRLHEIRVPTMVIVGDLDISDTLSSAENLVASIPNSRRETITGAAHLPSMEQPGEFNRIVHEFIRSV